MQDDSATISPPPGNSGDRTYADTVARGHYGRPAGGLSGKYDNVRTFWEDRLTRLTLAPFVRECDRGALAQGRKVRILDLGCGAGQGYDLLTQIDQAGLGVADAARFVLPSDRIGCYLGVDLSTAMVAQGRANYATHPGVRFEPLDLRTGLGAVAGEPPFDIYFSSYGSLSHLDTGELRRCLEDIARHAPAGGLVVLDLIGRYSPEWPDYWGPGSPDVLPYSMSYLYAPDERARGLVDTFPLRFWTGDEIRALCADLTRTTGTWVRPEIIADRSLFVGRHLDTREFGSTLPPLRHLVNRLYEQNVRTPLEDLRIGALPAAPRPDVVRVLERLRDSWNRVVDATLARLHGQRPNVVAIEGWREFPAALQMAILTMDRVIDGVAGIDVGDTRATIIEPQLAYVLQRLEHDLQQGLGSGHALLAVLRIGERQPASP